MLSFYVGSGDWTEENFVFMRHLLYWLSHFQPSDPHSLMIFVKA